ncbi:MAG: PHP domain-containing protein, partial [Clostridia bacterium]|nr:PHP domain-containing protein [Clostridia bacterium]
MAEFVHLHLHSEYSLLDGAARISEIPKYAASLGHTAVAITDHGVMYGAVAFYKACKAEGIHPIIGCEVYVAPKSRFDKNSRQDVGYHLVLLCKNELGYRNLCKLVSDAFIDGFYSKPRIDKELLRANAGGLIALSACFAGEIPTHIMSGNMGAAINSALEYASIFEENSFYLELQHHGLADDDTVCRGICEVAKHTGLPMVATNDVHYLRAEDAATQAVLLAIQTNHSLTEGRPFGFATDEFYYKSTEQMQALFPDLPEAIENT